MDFSLTEEQAMLEDSVARFVDNDYNFETRQKIAASETGQSAEIWQVFADRGWIAMPFPEEDGGLGGGRERQHPGDRAARRDRRGGNRCRHRGSSAIDPAAGRAAR